MWYKSIPHDFQMHMIQDKWTSPFPECPTTASQYQSLLELKEEKSVLNSTVLLYLLFQLTVQLEK